MCVWGGGVGVVETPDCDITEDVDVGSVYFRFVFDSGVWVVERCLVICSLNASIYWHQMTEV